MDSYTLGQLTTQAHDYLDRVSPAPIEAQKQQSIEGTIRFCVSMFISVSQEDIQRVVEQQWKRYVQENIANLDNWRP